MDRFVNHFGTPALLGARNSAQWRLAGRFPAPRLGFFRRISTLGIGAASELRGENTDAQMPLGALNGCAFVDLTDLPSAAIGAFRPDRLWEASRLDSSLLEILEGELSWIATDQLAAV